MTWPRFIRLELKRNGIADLFYDAAATSFPRDFKYHSIGALALLLLIVCQPAAAQNTTSEEKPIYVSEIQSRDWFQSLPITSMTLPVGRWLLYNPQNSINAYNLSLTSRSCLKIDFCGYGALALEKSQFTKSISHAPGQLPLEEVIALNSSGWFLTGHTEDLNGKRVIVLEGHDKERNLDLYRLEFNHNPDKSGVCIPATLTFTAPPSEYRQHIMGFKTALKTIRWIENVGIDPSKE